MGPSSSKISSALGPMAEKDRTEATLEPVKDGTNEPPVTKESVIDIDDGPTKDAQAGVLAIEAAASVWTKTHLILAYGL